MMQQPTSSENNDEQSKSKLKDNPLMLLLNRPTNSIVTFKHSSAKARDIFGCMLQDLFSYVHAGKFDQQTLQTLVAAFDDSVEHFNSVKDQLKLIDGVFVLPLIT